MWLSKVDLTTNEYNAFLKCILVGNKSLRFQIKPNNNIMKKMENEQLEWTLFVCFLLYKILKATHFTIIFITIAAGFMVIQRAASSPQLSARRNVERAKREESKRCMKKKSIECECVCVLWLVQALLLLWLLLHLNVCACSTEARVERVAYYWQWRWSLALA